MARKPDTRTPLQRVIGIIGLGLLGLVAWLSAGMLVTMIPREPESAKAARRAEEAEKEATKRAEEAKKEAECRHNRQCWGDKHEIAAAIYCPDKVERLANFGFEWTDKWHELKFSRVRWHSAQRGTLTYIGDRARAQNGFGAWQNIIYECDFDPATNAVLDVRARPGRL
ncbi:MAG: hypothetical protein F9K29_03405 [Hyphomicrobiaceae bacterium]|nr:MAG: hypothetical protein F9K29_03405 [Hyphomicrobiaceae bacterium]